MRKLMFGLMCLAAALSAGCAARDPSLARMEGTEPQRLAFGQPAAVKTAFAQKMQACWLSGTLPLLGGYQIDAAPGVIEVANIPTQVEQIRISLGQGDTAHVFIVQFTPFNDNTLISTRTINMPSDLAARLKRDVEIWIFGRDDCGTPYRQPGVMPAVNASMTGGGGQPQQTAQWQQSPDIPDTAVAASPQSTSRATLSRGTE